MSMTPKEIVADIQQLVSLPDICFRINELVEDPFVSVAEISDLISQDPALSVQLLKIANSPYYGFPSRIETVSRALMVVGTKEVRDMVLATTIVNTFSSYQSSAFDMEQFWHHSFMTGLAARHLSAHAKTPILHRDRLFIGGLLHNIGQLVMAMRIEEMVRQVPARVANGDSQVLDVDQFVLDVDHAEVGAELMRNWSLPESLAEIAEFHHHPQQADSNQLDVAIVHIAAAAVSRELAEDTPYLTQTTIDEAAWELTGLNMDRVGDSLEKVLGEYLGIESAFLGATQ
jgi:putative nucleotidyltransferase with HDIG domain